jgi:hypothetical protein
MVPRGCATRFRAAHPDDPRPARLPRARRMLARSGQRRIKSGQLHRSRVKTFKFVRRASAAKSQIVLGRGRPQAALRHRCTHMMAVRTVRWTSEFITTAKPTTNPGSTRAGRGLSLAPHNPRQRRRQPDSPRSGPNSSDRDAPASGVVSQASRATSWSGARLRRGVGLRSKAAR